MTPWQEALDAVLRSWAGTPYHLGSMCKGRGVDCARFAMAVFDELHGKKPVNDDASFTASRREASRQVLRLTERHPCYVVRDGTIEPGDMLLVDVRGRAGHVMIVGVDGRTLWHSTNGAGVVETSLEGYRHLIIRTLRSPERESWVASPATLKRLARD